MTDIASKLLSGTDIDKLRGWDDIVRPEPPQVIPKTIREEVETAVSQSSKNKAIRDKASKVLKRINELQQEIDKKAGKFKVTTTVPPGSPLYQAMVRVFNEKTDTVTYDHYKRALKYREQLAAEDAERLKNQ
jgi:predicted  nucleic acid-binding Zn ribbon protein